MPWRHGLRVSSPPAAVEIAAMGREIESLQGGSFSKYVLKKIYYQILNWVDCDQRVQIWANYRTLGDCLL
jgi:hypothetical protein